jgi:hypothetical protein
VERVKLDKVKLDLNTLPPVPDDPLATAPDPALDPSLRDAN